MYADDLQIYISGKVEESDEVVLHINEDLRMISSWAESNKIRLNPSKSNALCISRLVVDTTVFPIILLDNSQIHFVESVRNLGLYFNKTLTWSKHVKVVISKIYFGLRSLSVSTHFMPLDTRLKLAKTLLLPLITFGCEIYCHLDSMSKRSLSIAFNSIVRYVYKLKKYDHISQNVIDFLGCSFESFIKYKHLTYFNKIILGELPSYLLDKLTFGNSARSLSIVPPYRNYVVSTRQFFVEATGLWNSLPLDIRRQHNGRQFSDLVFNYLKSL